jgi:tetratricopeptide (TPR) repeat protein
VVDRLYHLPHSQSARHFPILPDPFIASCVAMIDSPYSSRSPDPTFSLDSDDDGTDEILIFEEDGDGPPGALELEEEYDYGLGFPEDLPRGYSMKELEHTVTFVRSSKEGTTGDFQRVPKSVLWCVQNGCEEAQPGVWSGCWYFTYLFGETEGRRAWLEAKSKRLVKESGGRARQLPRDDFDAMLQQKEKGRRAFYRGQYKTAFDFYRRAEEIMGGDVSGMYLVPLQRAEMVTILSNQAECLLRMRKYENAVMQATKALQLDRRHNKSLLRRARATISLYNTVLNSVAASSAIDDLETLIDMKGDGYREAKLLLDDISEKANLTIGG